jgi:hypothetical protein
VLRAVPVGIRSWLLPEPDAASDCPDAASDCESVERMGKDSGGRMGMANQKMVRPSTWEHTTHNQTREQLRQPYPITLHTLTNDVQRG